ncbi:MAG: coproporphyrinogen III oxidase, partial [Sphingomicrobium sp.]
MNTRFLTTTKRWFGGGADLNPAIPYAEDTEAFHARLRAACAAHDPTFYPRFSKWAEEYFYIPHRGVPRGAGGGARYPSTSFAGSPPHRGAMGRKCRPHFHLASGGRLIRIASTLPPVLRPNNVPRS